VRISRNVKRWLQRYALKPSSYAFDKSKLIVSERIDSTSEFRQGVSQDFGEGFRADYG